MAFLIPRTVLSEGMGEPVSPRPTTSSSASSTLSTGAAIAVAVVFGVLFILISLAPMYCLYWRKRKANRTPREFEIGEDGIKMKMQIQRERKTRSQDTLVPGEVSVIKGVIVREGKSA